jgi:hypothetical protein
VPLSASWPRWANWRNTAYALTYEPAVFVYHKPSFADAPPPGTRGGADRLSRRTMATRSSAGSAPTTSSAPASASCSFRATRSSSGPVDLVGAMGAAGVKLYSTTSAIVERVADGRSCSATTSSAPTPPRRRAHPDLGIILPPTTPSSRRASGSCRGPRPTRISAGAISNSSCRPRARRSWREAADRRAQSGRRRPQYRQCHAGGARRAAAARAGQPRADGLSRPGEAGPHHRALERGAAHNSIAMTGWRQLDLIWCRIVSLERPRKTANRGGLGGPHSAIARRRPG